MTDRAIIQLANYAAPYEGSFIPSLLRLAQHVTTNLGLGTVLALPEAAKVRPWLSTVRKSGVTLAFISRAKSRVSRAREIAALVEEHHGLLLHSHFSLFDLEAALIGRLRNVKVVWHVHSLFSMAPVRNTPKDFVRWRVVGRTMVEGIVPVSDGVAKIIRMKGAPPERVKVILNGIDTARFGGGRAEGKTIRILQYGIPEGAKVALMFGWSPYVKGVDLLVRAAAKVNASASSRVHFLVVGGESNEHQLRDLARHIPEVHVIPPVEDVASLYHSADCFISASRSEGFPFAIAEAMASGLPVISSDLPHLCHVFGAAGDGFRTFHSEDPEGLALVLRGLFGLSSVQLGELGRSNQQFVRQTLGIDRWCDEIVGLYKSILSE